MNEIAISDAKANNLKNVSVRIPLGKLVAVVGKSGSGKSSFVYDILYRASTGEKVDALVSGLPRTLVVEQNTKTFKGKSLDETRFSALQSTLKQANREELVIIDEPCAGLASKDRLLVLSEMKSAVQRGVSIIVVEHSKDIIANADYVIEFGPGAGAEGGQIVFKGSLAKFKLAHTLTSDYAFSDKASRVDYARVPNRKALAMKNRSITISGVNVNEFGNRSFSLGLGRLVAITGRIGSGKSDLLKIIYGALFKGAGAWKYRQGFKSIDGKSNIRRTYIVEQSVLSPILTSTVATYMGIWDPVRDIYSSLPESKRSNLAKSDFSLSKNNSSKNKPKLEQARYRGASIYDATRMTVSEAADHFRDFAPLTRKLGFLEDLGLGYLELGQRSGTLSGGESQRVRLAKILSKKLGDRCLYILDTPSRGLHLSDLPPLMRAFQKIIDKNNTILVAENREEIIANCDEVIRL